MPHEYTARGTPTAYRSCDFPSLTPEVVDGTDASRLGNPCQAGHPRMNPRSGNSAPSTGLSVPVNHLKAGSPVAVIRPVVYGRLKEV
jgi:hypothetical protein